ncbi:TPM domain-containing protein [Segatella copri]|uniref:TPM domain-containing protein n=1 Tax=Segatella copri TaxID=165179 RepID=UPI00296F045E|nr:TPM domain-containing protein [Segatella copri]WOZ86124.1 TPM domain-containing protein [Segatella copri]
MLFIGVAFSVLSLAASREWSAQNVPIPFLKDSTQYVSDPDGLVGKAQKDSANLYLQKLKLECGVQNVLIIVGKVENQDAFRMAQDVGNKYGIGYKKSRRGLVIVIAVEDHKYFIAPGSGLEGELTDVDCDDIARACIVKYMREDDPGEAVASVSRAIYNKVKSGRTGIESVDEGTVNGEEDWALVIILFLLFFGVPIYYLVRYILEQVGVLKPRPKGKGRNQNRRRNDDDDWLPPFFMGGGGFSGGGGGGFSGGSFGGGSFSGGGSGGSW